MPRSLTILNTKYYYQHKNGVDFDQNLSDFTLNLARNNGLKAKFSAQIEIEWFANADPVDTWLVESTKITRNVGSFYDDGFYVGQTFDYISDWSTDNTSPIDFTGEVTSISVDGDIMTFSVTVGAVTTGNQNNVGIRARAQDSENYLTGLFYKFGLIENDENFNFTSKITDSDSVFYADEIGAGSPRSNTFVPMVWQGTNKGGLTGSAQIRYVSDTTYVQTYEIEHIFTILPYFLEEQLNDIKNGVYPDYLEGDNSLKHSYEVDFRLVLSNPNTSVSQIVDNVLGSVGWFGESLNGLATNYQIDSIAYQDSTSLDAVESLQYNAKTTATITISKVAGSFVGGERVGLFVSYLPPESEYKDTLTTYDDNFLYDIIYYTEGDLPSVGSGIIKILSSSISSGTLVIVAEFEYSSLQSAMLTTSSNYLIGVECADSSLTNENTDSTVLLADINTYSEVSLLDQLITFSKFNFLQHNEVLGVDTGSLTISSWNEDGILIDFGFELDLNKSALLETLNFKLVAFDSTANSYFELDSFSFDLSEVITSLGVQQIEIDTTRGYELKDGDQFNNVKITTGTESLGFQSYTGSLGQKISWEDWIKNLNANQDFYDNSKPNDNLNFKSSNYSGLNNYEIKMLVTGTISGVDDLGRDISGTYNIFSGDLDVFDYDMDINPTPVWNATIQTFDASGTVNFDGKISTEVNTLFQITWSQANPVLSLPDYVIHRMQITGDTGKNIFEISSILDRLEDDNPLIPVDGESFLKVEIVGDDVVSTCLIDKDKLQNSNWRLSGRIKA